MTNKLLLPFISGVLFSSYLLASKVCFIQESTGQTTSLNIDHTHETPFPVGLLDSQTLGEFMPFIMAEIAAEFSHQNDSRTRRDTRQYGFNFFKMLKGDFSYSAPPDFYQQLGELICIAFGHEPVEFTNVILSVYEKDFYLEPHVDVNIKNPYGEAPFYFGERVYGIVIEPDATGHLYFAKWEGEGLVPPLDIPSIYSLNEQVGTIFALKDLLDKRPTFMQSLRSPTTAYPLHFVQLSKFNSLPKKCSSQKEGDVESGILCFQ